MMSTDISARRTLTVTNALGKYLELDGLMQGPIMVNCFGLSLNDQNGVLPPIQMLVVFSAGVRAV